MSTEDADKWEATLASPLPGMVEDYDDFSTGASVITAEGSIL